MEEKKKKKARQKEVEAEAGLQEDTNKRLRQGRTGEQMGGKKDGKIIKAELDKKKKGMLRTIKSRSWCQE